MRRHDKKRIIAEANQRLEKEFIQSKVVLKENREPKLSDKEIDVISKILEGDILDEGEEVLAEGKFSDIRQKFNSALKKGEMSFGILAAVLGSPNMTQAQKVQLKKDVTDSTWFLDKAQDIKNNPITWSQGDSWDNPDFQQDLKDKRDPDKEAFFKKKEAEEEAGKYTKRSDYNKEYQDAVGSNFYRMEKWVNNLGQDSTVYKQYKDEGYNSETGRVGGMDLQDEPVKTIVNKDDVKAWRGDGWSEVTKKGNVGNYYWTEDGQTAIKPWQWKGLQKVEKLTKAGKTDKLQKQVYKDRGIASGKRLMDKGFKSSDFYKVDLDQIDSPPGGDYPSDYPEHEG